MPRQFANSIALPNGTYILDGTVAPEGAVTAPVGSEYTFRPAGTKYTKATGTGNTGWLEATANNSSSGTTRVKLPASVTNANATANTMQDVTGLAFPVSAGVDYGFRFWIVYDAQTTANGCRFGINGPAKTILAFVPEYTATATTRRSVSINGYDQPATASADNLLTDNLAIIQGIIRPSAAGNVIARFAAELASTGITCKPPSYVDYWAI